MEGKNTDFKRPRIIVYALILTGITIGTIIAISMRSPIELDIIRDRNSLFRETGMGMIENVYTLKVINKDKSAHEYTLSAEGIEGMKLKLPKKQIYAESGAVVEVPVSIEVDPELLKQRTSEIFFKLDAINSDLGITEEARFLGPRLGR